MNIWVKAPRRFPGAIFNFVASCLCRRVLPKSPILSIFSRIAPRALGSVSTKRQNSAPLEIASRFKAQRARASEDIRHDGAVQGRGPICMGEDVKNRLTGLITRRAGITSARRGDITTAKFTRNYTHYFRRPVEGLGFDDLPFL